LAKIEGNCTHASMVLPLHTPLQSNNDGDSQHFKSVPVVKQENTTNQSWYKDHHQHHHHYVPMTPGPLHTPAQSFCEL
jgi:hypothetical protein